MFKKILWGYDDSDDSIRAFEFVKLLSKEYNSDVTGISVLPFYIERLALSGGSNSIHFSIHVGLITGVFALMLFLFELMLCLL